MNTITTVNTVKIYRINRYRAPQMSAQGVFFDLSPACGDLQYYGEEDDGGQNYILPPEFHLGKDRDGISHIYRDGEADPIEIVKHQTGRPQLWTQNHNCPVLQLNDN